MLKQKMADALNEQINKEMYSAYLYLAMSAYCHTQGLHGFSNWFDVQYKEEMFHAMKIYHYLQEQGSAVRLKAIEEPPAEFGAPLEMFKAVLEHEQFITKSINDLMALSIAENDYATQIFLQWYITEQVEEEANDNEIIDRLTLIGDHPNALYMFDKELGSRTFNASEE